MTLQIIITLRYGSTACREVYNGFAISLVSEDFCKQNDEKKEDKMKKENPVNRKKYTNNEEINNGEKTGKRAQGVRSRSDDSASKIRKNAQGTKRRTDDGAFGIGKKSQGTKRRTDDSAFGIEKNTRGTKGKSDNSSFGTRKNTQGAKRKSNDSATGINKKNNMSSVNAGKCPVSKKCGGCQMIDVPYKEQIKRKHEREEELLGEYGTVEPFIEMEHPDHYRCKVHAVFTHDRKGNPVSGIYKEGTHDVVPVDACYLENEKADAIIATIRGMLKSFKIKTFDEDNGYGLFRHVLIRVGHNTGEIMVVLVLTSPILPSKNNFVKALLKEHPEITTIVINVNDKRTSMILGDKEKAIYGPGFIYDTVCGMKFKISPKSFYQVNPVQTEKLYSKAVELAGLTGKETVLDCYCGVGTIGIIASPHAAEVIGVELNKDAVRDARLNARMNEIKNITIYENDASRFMVQMAEAGDHADVVFMDPPRSGSTEIFMDSMFKLNPDRIVYISCSPDSLARDLEYITKNGYKADRIIPVDMFPFTRSCETVVLLSKLH